MGSSFTSNAEAVDKDDFATLYALNMAIGAAESAGERAWLARMLAPTLAFARADGASFDDVPRFLAKVAPSARRDTTIDSIEVMGNRAVVRCRVKVLGPEGAREFHNLRLFVRHETRWKLLGWANESLA